MNDSERPGPPSSPHDDQAPAMQVTDALIREWLALVCKMVPGARGGLAGFDNPGESELEYRACWPLETPPSEGLRATARLALSRGTPVVAGDRDSGMDIAHPIKSGGSVVGVVAVSAQVPGNQQQAVIQVLHWGTAWLDFLNRLPAPESVADTSLALEAATAALAEEQLRASALAVAGLIAHRLECDRVSIGLVAGDSVNIIALSDTSSFDARTNLLRRLQSAMEETIARAKTEGLDEAPAPPSSASPMNGGGARSDAEGVIYTVLLYHHGRVIGAISMERGPRQIIGPQTVALCESIALLVAPVLDMKRERERPLGEKLTGLLSRLSGPKGLRFALAIAALLGLLVYLAQATSEFRITATAKLEGTVLRAVVAPYESYISAAYARAGETVKRGQLLAELDDRDLKLEQRKWTGRRDGLRKQHRQALATFDRAQAQIVGSQIEQVEANLALVEEQLARSRLLAPFDGVVIAGDLSRKLGSPVERGQLLFEVAPLDQYRVILEVTDWDISAVRVEQRGTLTLSSVPDKPFEFVVSNISSISQNVDGRPTFRVEARAEKAREYLRPGMGGIGKIVVGERKLLWIWSRPLRLRLQLWLWRWLP